MTSGHRAGERAAKNTAVRAAGEVAGKVATFALFAVLARSVGQDGVGAFVFALAFLQIAMVPVGLGTDGYLLRQVAKDRESADRLLFNSFALKLAAALPVISIALVVVSLLGYESQTRETVYVLAAGILFELLAKSIHSVFNATERGDLLTVTLIVQRVATAVAGIGALAAGNGVVAVAAVYSGGAALHLALCFVLLARRIGLPRRLVSRRDWAQLARTSAPFAAQEVFGVVLFRLDAVLLSLLATQAAVGLYGAAYRLMEATLFISWALNGAFAAMYAYLGRETVPTVSSVFQRSLKAGLAILTPCAVLMGALPGQICRLAFGADFVPAADALRLLAPVVVLMSFVTLSSSLIISRLTPRRMVEITAGAVVANAALNLALIPPLAEVGAALAMLLTEAGVVAVAMRLAVSEVGGIDWPSMAAAPMVAAAAMLPVCLALGGLPVVAAAAGLAVYMVVFVALDRQISPDDLAFVAGLVRRRLSSPTT
jgi:O-antigen/teichoic acid export membrane protein